MNYTKPYDHSHQDTPQDWLNGALLFSSALSLILEENEGVIVDIKGDINFDGNPKKVIVYYSNHKINIENYDGDEKEGTLVWMQE